MGQFFLVICILTLLLNDQSLSDTTRIIFLSSPPLNEVHLRENQRYFRSYMLYLYMLIYGELITTCVPLVYTRARCVSTVYFLHHVYYKFHKISNYHHNKKLTVLK